MGLGKVDEDIPPEKEIMYKRYIAEKNYSESKLITWKSDSLEKFLANNKSGVEGTNINSIGNKNLDLISEINGNNNEKLFLLIISKAQFSNKQFGYIFLFRREHVKCVEKTEKVIKSILNDMNSISPKNKNSKFLKKQKLTFSSFKSSDNIIVKNEKENKMKTKRIMREKIKKKLKKILNIANHRKK